MPLCSVRVCVRCERPARHLARKGSTAAKGVPGISYDLGGTLQESGVDRDKLNAAPVQVEKSQVEGCAGERDGGIHVMYQSFKTAQ